jgi:hypothetical protein
VSVPAMERLLAKVDIPDHAPATCWIWQGAIDPNGYGRFHFDGRMLGAHRVAYTLLVGEVPDGMDLDHLCRTRDCVRPSHLEPVTRQVNLLRGDTLTAAHAERRDCGHTGCRSCRRHPDRVEALS